MSKMRDELQEELSKLSFTERLELVQDLWDGIAADCEGKPVPLTEAQRAGARAAGSRARRAPGTRDSLGRGSRASASAPPARVTSQLALSPAALDDLRTAVDWYDAQRPGLGDLFLHSVEACFARIERLPHSFPENDAGVRSALLRRFPTRCCSGSAASASRCSPSGTAIAIRGVGSSGSDAHGLRSRRGAPGPPRRYDAELPIS